VGQWQANSAQLHVACNLELCSVTVIGYETPPVSPGDYGMLSTIIAHMGCHTIDNQHCLDMNFVLYASVIMACLTQPMHTSAVNTMLHMKVLLIRR
jgi:hypothetical protein